MRTTFQFNLPVSTKKEAETKIYERVAAYLEIDPSEVAEKTDVEILLFVGEDAPMQLRFMADCRVKVKN